MQSKYESTNPKPDAANTKKEIKPDSIKASASNTITPAMRDSLAKKPPHFLKVADKYMKWEVPTEPTHTAGPIYYVGTKELFSF